MQTVGLRLGLLKYVNICVGQTQEIYKGKENGSKRIFIKQEHTGGDR